MAIYGDDPFEEVPVSDDDLTKLGQLLHEQIQAIGLILALEAELTVAQQEAAEVRTDRNRYEAGYHQGWADAIRMILIASGLDQAKT